MSEPEFAQLIGAVRNGDEQAAEKLVRQYEPYLRHVIHGRLTDPHLRRVFDSLDICQSIFADFFARASVGGFDLNSPEGLKKLLVTMALNRLISKARAERNHAAGWPAGWEPTANGQVPTQAVDDQDLLQAVRDHLSEPERRLLDGRAAGKSWKELARDLHDTPDGLRMRYVRAVARVRRALPKE